MNRVKLGDVSNEVKERCPTPELNDLPAVGLEHLDPERLSLRRFGNPGQNGFTKRFKGGDILFGRRRAYQKKAAVATSDGVCSGDIIVIRPIEQKIDPLLLPFIIQNDFFFDFAIGNSAGSLSPRVKWARLAEFEFSLPDKENQHRLEETLWSCEEVIEDYDALLDLLDGVTKSRFVEMFGDPRSNTHSLLKKRLDEVADTRLGKMLDAKRQTGENAQRYLTNRNVRWFGFDFDNLNSMDFSEGDRIEFSLRQGDLLVCEGGEVGRCAVWKGEIKDCYFQKALHRVRCNADVMNPVFLSWLLKIMADEGMLIQHTNAATIAHLSGEKLKGLPLIVPSIELQNEFAAFVEQVDKSVFS